MVAQPIPFQAAYTILDLTQATLPLSGTEAIEVIQGNQSVQTTLQAVALALIPLTVKIIRLPVFAASVSILTTDVEVGIDTGAGPVTVNLPSAAAWQASAGLTGLDLVIVDINGNALNNAITPALNGGDIFKYGGVTPTITMNYGTLRLRPYGTNQTTVTGWYVRGVNV